MSSDPFISQEARDALSGRIKFSSAEEATFVACGIEIATFDERFGARREDTYALLREVDGPLREIVEAHAETIVMIRFDGNETWLHADDDDQVMKSVEAMAFANGHSVMAILPADIRHWVLTEGRACLAAAA